MGVSVVVNGRERALERVEEPCSLSDVIAALELKPDRVAVELNGAIASRTRWDETPVRTGDRLEIVHFVGGGSPGGEPKEFIGLFVTTVARERKDFGRGGYSRVD